MELSRPGRRRCHKMKKYLVAFLLGVVCLDCFAMSGVVKYIVDGDTFVADISLNNGGRVKSVSVRLHNVDTPELHGQCDSEIKMANSAKQRLSELIPVGSIVEMKNIKDDKYAGRIDANVFDSRGVDVGLVLVKEKFGRAYAGGRRESWCE